MAARTYSAICTFAVFVQAISAQCLGDFNALGGPGFNPEAYPFAGPGLSFGSGYGPACGSYAGMSGMTPSNLGASCGGGLAVTSTSPFAPTGLTLTSENAIEGALAVVGNMPFLGTVAVEGLYQTAGLGAVSYGCGNGAIGITEENPIAPVSLAPMTQAGIAPSAPMASRPGYSPLGYMGMASRPGCGGIY